ncbi:MAG TPA: hypothetical protein VGO56_16905 [Pyrinomonadaceae bacterium]|jgi:hypothetical protein|nr:hypothetical protein [Pyrinomonadaceae bacterium]
MKLPDVIWSSALLLCVVVAASAQHELARPSAASSPSSQTASGERAGDSDHGREVAARFAPVFYQALGDKPRSDYITNFDFDGDWVGDNNWEHLDDKQFPLRAYIYYSVSETRTHYFIHYAVFHPRDYKGGERKGLILSEIIREGTKHATDHDPTGLMAEAGVAHENDMEGALVVVAKNGKDLDRARTVFVETLHHDDFSPYVTGESAPKGFGLFKTDGRHVLLYVEPKGHGIEPYTDSEKQTAKKEFLIYRFGGKAEDPDKQKRGSVGYELLPIETTLWPKVRNTKESKNTTYGTLHDYAEISINVLQPNGQVAVKQIKIGEIGETFAGDSGGLNMARPPWAWFDKGRRSDPLGLWFFDPARIVKRDFKLDESFSTAYVRLPFWAAID